MTLMSFPAKNVSLADVRRQLALDGACWLTDLDASTPEALLGWAGQLGSWDLGIDEDFLGPRLMHLRLDPAKQALADQPAYFTADEFPLHTDVSYVPNPPGLMLLHCVQPDPDGGGLVKLARCDDALPQLQPEQIDTLRSPVFRFLYPPACTKGASDATAILSGGRWRFKFSRMQFHAEHAAAVEALHQALLRASYTVPLQSGDLLVVDNHRMVHGRTAFTGNQRHIMRCYVSASAR